MARIRAMIPSLAAALALAPPVSQDQFSRLSTVVAVCWWAISFALIFFMQSGFLLLEAGSIRAKNAAHVSAKVLAHTGIAIACFWLVGFAIKAFAWPLCYVLHQAGTGTVLAHVEDAISGYVGWASASTSPLPWHFAAAPDVYMVNFFGSLTFCLTSTAIPGTVFSERFRFKAYLIYAALYSGIVYPIFGFLIWGGLGGSPLLDPNSGLVQLMDRWFTPELASAAGKRLLEYGMVADAAGKHFWAPYTDYAGSTGVHALGGIVGLVGAYYVGPRLGRYRADGQPTAIPAHNVLLTVFSALLLAFCWFGFNGGSVVANAASHPLLGKGAGARGLYLADYLFSDIWWVFGTTALAAAGGVLGALLAGFLLHRSADPLVLANGLLGGLVAICACVGFAPPGYGLLVGAIAGFQFPFTFRWVERKLKIDDAIGTIACHLASGVIGGLLAGIYGQLFWWGVLPDTWVHPGGDMLGGTTIPTLGIQFSGLVVLVLYGVPAAYAIFKICDRLVGVRTTPEEEREGLDLSEHGLEAYPVDPGNR
jgi:Amt family ammonium transporter